MYQPSAFSVSDSQQLISWVRQYPFAVFNSQGKHRASISHIPLILEYEEDQYILYGHLAKSNPHASHLIEQCSDGQSTAVFMGPHGYISPTWYHHQPAVPTWNYTAVHASGHAKVIVEPERISHVMKRQSNFFERESNWSYDQLPEDYRHKMQQHVVAFRMVIQHLEGVFKLSQNQTTEEQKTIIQHLKESTRLSDQELSQEMQKRALR
jgi:transcriptional regulator